MIALRRASGFSLALAASVVCLGALTAVAAQARDFEVPTFVAPGRNSDQSPSTKAGEHPFELANYFAVNRTPTAEELPSGGHEGPVANVKDLSFGMPAGMVFNAASFPRCTQEAFNGNNCSLATQVGIAGVDMADGQESGNVPVFNMIPPPGLPAQLAYRVNGSTVRVDLNVRSGGDYGFTASLDGMSEAFGLLTSSLTIWGVPGDPGHDALRFTGAGLPAPGPYPEPAPYRALLSNPTSCNGPLVTTMNVTTWQQPDESTSAAPFEALGMGGCNQLDFNPTIEAKPTTNLGDSPSGLEVHLDVPQNKDAEALAAAHLRTSKIVLPPGLTANASAANGLGSCSTEQIGFTGLSNERQLIRYDLPPKAFSGTFVVSFGEQSTAAIPATASRSEVTEAIEGLPGLAGNVSLSGAQGGWIVSFTGALAATEVPSLSGTVSDNPSQKLTVTGEGGTYILHFGGESTVALPFNATPEAIQEALRELPAIGLGNLYPGNVYVSAFTEKESTRSFQIIFAEDLAGAQPTLTATSSLTGAGAAITAIPVPPPTPRPLSIAPVGGIAPGTPQFTEAAANCPDASKIGTARIDTPITSHPLEGIVYLATPGQNPFKSLLAFYISVNDPQSGVVVKMPGLVETDPATGQLTATISEFPQLPFEDLQLEFFKGSAAPLKTGIACGAYSVDGEMTSWAAPESAVTHPSDTFEIEKGAAAGACVKDEVSAPNAPKFEAGTFEPTGGTYSPLTLKLTRQDGSQRLSGFDATLPKGLTAKLAGIPYCSDAALAAAAAKSGQQELASSSCPAASRVGSINAGAGAGPTPFYVQGNIYLAGPYKGAPLSLAAIAPAVGGPFDLGDVVDRIALHVDPESTQVRAVSDPLPSILDGIPLDLRSVVFSIDRGQFTLNPTACGSTAITGSLTALSGQSVPLAEHFQVGECAKLGFKPKLALSLKGSTKRGGHPALKSVLTAREGDANLAQALVTLPKSEHLDNANIKAEAVCSSAQFAASQCPAASIFGFARAVSSQLEKPIEGPVYMRSSANSLPDLVADLGGQVNVVLDGRIASTKGGGLQAAFENIPDVPVSQFVFELKGGKGGLLKNSANLCAHANKATVLLSGQNGASLAPGPVVTDSCKKGAKPKKHSKHSKHGAGK